MFASFDLDEQERPHYKCWTLSTPETSIMIIFGRKYYIFDAFRSLLLKGQLAVSSSGRLGDWLQI